MISYFYRYPWIMVLMSSSYVCAHSISSTTSNTELSNLNLHKVYLRQQKQNTLSPWCYALTIDPTVESTNNINYNFLASQVWPSARVAAKACESYFQQNSDRKQKQWKICELGCGTALPSLALANMGMSVVATDLDELALQMAKKAANEQNLGHNFCTKVLDLTGDVSVLDEINADLYILSDVFESSKVAEGAARMTLKALKSGASVWCFAQSDRVQREAYRLALERTGSAKSYGDLEWKVFIDKNFKDRKHGGGDLKRLLLCDLDEVQVDY